MKFRKTILWFILVAFVGMSIVNISSPIPLGRTQSPSIRVAVSIIPQVEWIQEIGGEYVEVLSLIPAGQSPHSYSPTTTELIFVATANVWFQMGLIEFDIAHNDSIRQAGSSMQIVNLSIGLDLIPMVEQHEDEPTSVDEDHDHGALDPHTWTSPTRVIQMVNVIAAKLAEIDPTHATIYTTNAATYVGKLNALNTTITGLMSNVTNKNMLVFHPSYGYFCHDFGLNLIPLEENGQDPSSKHYVEILDEVKEEGVGAIFIQAEISENMAKSFANDAGVEIVRLYPLAPNYLSNMTDMAYLIAEKLDQPPKSTYKISSYPIVSIFLAIGCCMPFIYKRFSTNR